MSRRKNPREEMEFGSDSFLDVVANVVGILIILMVLAGIRAKTAPVNLAEEAPETTHVETPPAVVIAAPPVDDETKAVRQQELAALQSKSDSLQQELDRLRQTANADATKLTELQSQDAVQKNRFTTLASNLEGEFASLRDNQQESELLEATLRAVRVRLKKRQAEVAAAEKQPNRVEKLQHRITPVSRVLREGETELNFRCLGGAVSLIPLRELESRMWEQIHRRAEALTSFKHSDFVGPVCGWTLEYETEIIPVRGGRLPRPVAARCHPEPDLDSEIGALALKPQSSFRNELRNAEPGSTITFWVYPDSFHLFRKLQAVAHREGFSVAARPLEDGEFIGISRKGKSSEAQ